MHQTALANSVKEVLSELHGDKRYLIAVSGGVDSMVLLHLIKAIKTELDIYFEVAHVDHSLRINSSEDAKFVLDCSTEFGVKCNLIKVAPPEDKPINIETWGRQQRYSFFKDLLESRGLNYVFTAHHGGDVTETLLMRMLSNRELGNIIRIDESRRLCRPLLKQSKNTILTFAEKHKIRWVEDQSNLDTDYTRNNIRHNLIPYLQQLFGENIIDLLTQKGLCIADDESAIEIVVNKYVEELEPIIWNDKAWFRDFVAKLELVPLSFHWRIINNLFRSHFGLHQIGRFHSERILEFIHGIDEGVQLVGGKSIRRSNGGIKIIE